MDKINIFKELKLANKYWGDSIEINISEDISNEVNRFNILDQVCESENLTKLGAKWKELNIEKGKVLLLNALRFDLAYTSFERTSESDAIKLVEIISKEYQDSDSFCYTNYSGNPWDGKPSCSWNSLTSNTVDMGIVFIKSNKLTFTYFISED